MQQQAWTIGRLIDWSKKHLAEKGVDQPRLAVELLLSHALHCSKIELYTHFEDQPDHAQLAVFREGIRAAGEHYPVAYLVGRKEFYGLDFNVNPAVLIPRPETEVLVDRVIRYCRSLDQQQVDILDLGTGSGCIGLAICRHVTGARVWGSDISDEALAVAQANAQALGLGEHFQTIHADGLNIGRDGFDLLVSNPPYVGTNGQVPLDDNVRQYEPHQALFAGPDGLAFYKSLAAGAQQVLKPQAAIFVEIGCGQHDSVVDIMTAKGRYQHVHTWSDLNEGHPRVLRFDRRS